MSCCGSRQPEDGMKFDPKILPFDRGPAYTHQRAMQSRRENNLLDAVGLLRRAVEQSPENREYKLDLAELYCEMGCHEQSNRLLLDMLAEKDAPAECLYGLALNRLHVNDEKGARHALRQYLHAAPNGEHVEDARQLTAELDYFEEMRLPRDRRHMRAQRIADKALSCMSEGESEKADAYFRRSLEMAPDQVEVLAFSALNLMQAGRAAEALEGAQRVLNAPRLTARARGLVALVYYCNEDMAACEAQLRAAIAEEPNEFEARMLANTAWQAELHELAADLARRALFSFPHDRELLHVRAVALLKTGAPLDKALALWTRILRIDPEDTVAAYYVETAKKGELRVEELPYFYRVPDVEYDRRLHYIADQLSVNAEAIAAHWRSDPDFRLLLKWCTGVHNESFQRAAVTVLAAMEDDEAVSMLREYLSRGYVSPQLKLQASAVLNLRGADLSAFLPVSDDAAETLLPGADELLQKYSVGTRQLIRFAADVLEDKYGLSALPGLTMLWTQYVCGRDVRACAHSAPEAGAAALAACYLSAGDAKPDPERLCREFGCTARQFKYIYRCMMNALAGRDGGKNETD